MEKPKRGQEPDINIADSITEKLKRGENLVDSSKLPPGRGGDSSSAQVIIRKQPGCLVQIIWFVLIGWWLGGIAVSVAYFFFATIIGIPVGIWLLNKLPYVLALRDTEPTILDEAAAPQQFNIIIRALWFFLVGLWLTGIWLSVAYFFTATIIGMPIGFWMFDRTATVLTLRQTV